MTPEEHRSRAETWHQAVSGFPAEALPAVIEAYVFAGTDLLNAVLHEAGFTRNEDDVMHAEFMSTGIRNKIELLRPGIIPNLDSLEWMRGMFVRGSILCTDDALSNAEITFGDLYQSVIAL